MPAMHTRRHDLACYSVTGVVIALLTVLVVTVPTAAVSPPSTDMTSPTTSPTMSSTPSTPEPIAPPAHSVFDETVGGELLGMVGGPPVVADNAPELPALEAPCWLLADAGSGEILATRNPHEPRPPASTIKLLTAVSALSKIESDDTYVATNQAAGIEGSKVGIVPEQSYSVENILHGMFLSSGNDAAYALGELVGGQDRIIGLMNDTADELGAFDTEAKTPHGLDTAGQQSSAYDLALIGRAALQDDQILELTAQRTYDFPGLDGETFQIQNTNRLIGSYDGAIGLKNGYTSNAGHTLVAAARRDDTTLLAVIMGAEGRAEDVAAELLDWGFTAADAEPVGILVTPDDVQAAAQRQTSAPTPDGGSSPTAAGAGGGHGSAVGSREPGQLVSARTAVLVGSVAVAATFGLMITLRRSRRPGRYAAARD